jgi:urease subunit alpha
MFGAFGGARSATSVHFVSEIALERSLPEELGLSRALVGVRGTRSIGKRDMIHNGYLPVMEVDSQTYQVRADGQLLTCEPLSVLPLAQRYFLF